MQWCGLLVYAGQAKTKVATTWWKKIEDNPVQTAAGEAPSTECPLHITLPQNTGQPNPHKVAVEHNDSLGQ